MSEVVSVSRERELSRNAQEASEAGPAVEDRAAVGALENALAACEDDQDVQAARTAKAEAVADLAEFDENIPLDEQQEKEPEISKAEQEVENLIKQVRFDLCIIFGCFSLLHLQLTPIERYAMRFIEETETAWSAEQLAAAEREIEEQKREWEENRLAAMREEEKRRAREMEEESDLLTFSREDATNQVSKTKKVANRRGSANRKVVKRVKVAKTPAKSPGDVKKTAKISESTESEPEVVVKRGKGRPRGSTRVAKRTIEPDSTTQTSISDNEPTKINGDDTNDSNNSKWSCDDELVDSSDSDSLPLARKVGNSTFSNHIDHNSPRTRSHGRVAINLWTLDVSPILPGVKPVIKNSNTSTAVKRERSRNSSSEKEVCVDSFDKSKKNSSVDEKRKTSRRKLNDGHKRKLRSKSSETNSNNAVAPSENNDGIIDDCKDGKQLQKAVSMCKEKVCKVVVQDVMTTDEVSKYLPKNNNKNVDITRNLDGEVEVEIAKTDESFNLDSDKTMDSNKKRKVVKNNSTLDGWLQKSPQVGKIGKDDVVTGNSILRTSNNKTNED